MTREGTVSFEDHIALRSEHARLLRVFGRFVRAEDCKLSDREFVEMALARWLKHLAAEIVDVGE